MYSKGHLSHQFKKLFISEFRVKKKTVQKKNFYELHRISFESVGTLSPVQLMISVINYNSELINRNATEK